VHERAEKAKNERYYFKSHGMQALAIESAQVCAEWLHRRILEDWGFPDPRLSKPGQIGMQLKEDFRIDVNIRDAHCTGLYILGRHGRRRTLSEHSFARVVLRPSS